MLNYNNTKRMSFNSESHTSKDITEHGNYSPVEDEDIIFIGTTPEISVIVSPIGKNIVIPQTNRFSERKSDHNRQPPRQHNSFYHQPKSAPYSSYYQPQPAKYNQRQQYFQNRKTQQAYHKNDYNRDKVKKNGDIHSDIPTTEKKYPIFHWETILMQ